MNVDIDMDMLQFNLIASDTSDVYIQFVFPEKGRP